VDIAVGDASLSVCDQKRYYQCESYCEWWAFFNSRKCTHV